MILKDQLNLGHSRPLDLESLRAAAEAQLGHAHSKEIAIASVEELLHELQVHQIELQMQNETLRQSQLILEESRDRYVDFYDFAPTGYFTLNSEALITEINFTGAKLLGKERSKLVNRRFAQFIAPEHKELWHLHFMAALHNDVKQSCELKIRRDDGLSLFVQLDSLQLLRDGKQPVVRISMSDINEHTLTENALRESETRQRMLEQREIVQTSLDGFWVVDTLTARILEANDAFCEMVGYTRAELLTMRISDLEVEESRVETEAHIQKITLDGYDRFETRHRHKQGHLVNLEMSVTHSNSGGGINLVFTRNITERKQSETKLRESETRFRTLFESATDCMLILDQHGRIIDINHTGYERLGYQEQEMLGRHIAEFDTTEYAALAPERLAKIEREGGATFESAHVHKDGTVMPVEVSARIIYLNGEQRYLSAIRDISERKRAEVDLRDREERLRAIVNQIFCGIVHSVNSGYITFANDRFCEIIGYSREELLGKHWDSITHPDDLRHHTEFNTQYLREDKPFTLEKRYIRKNGETVWVNIGASTLHDFSGNILGIASIVVDITDRKQMEKAMQEHRDEMEQLQKMHVAAQTASAIAHEMNQPLLAIASYCQASLMMMKSENPDYDEVYSAIENSEQQALRAGHTIRDLINFLNRSEFPTETLSLNKEIIEIVNHAQSEHSLVFHANLKLKEGLVFVRVNRIHLQKVLLNLLLNGLDAMQNARSPRPTISVTVSTLKHKGMAQITIQDNGPGIKEEDLPRLFEPFFTTKTKGIGMGLAISHSLIETNGGQLWAESSAGCGATFHLTLPLEI